MEAYFEVLRTATSREMDPTEAERDKWAAPASVRRYLHAHVRRHLRMLRAAYAARATLVAQSSEDDRKWLTAAREDMTALDDELGPWEIGAGRRSVAVLGVAASASAILRGLNVDSDVVLTVALVVLLSSAFGLALAAVLALVMLWASYVEKRALLTEAGVYEKEDGIYATLGLRKRPEPLTDYAILEVLVLVIGIYLAAFLGLLELPSAEGGIAIGVSAGLVVLFALFGLESRERKRRTPR